eukprot:Tamp_17297.p1 GENE.Tamp_17297~~Tamp_17297.p1  ORF type:complete len:429 (+),score=71.01 Tamp_17297:120-1289(+)
MPPDYVPDVFATAETNHLQYYQDADGNEWKWETTQNLQREFMAKLFNISSTLHAHPDAVSSYEDLREHLDAHCNRVFNGTCEWQFSPPFNPALAGGAGDGGAKGVQDQPTRGAGAIVYVCCADAHELQDLLWSLKLLDLNFNDQFRYPVLIFHENLGTAQRNLIKSSTRSDVQLHRVSFRIPAFVDPNYVPRWYHGYSLGFRHMIRFLAMKMYEHSALEDYDYYWRLDSDSFLISRVFVDPIEFMQQNDYKFGFIATTQEKPVFTADLFELHEAHRRNLGLVSEWFSGSWNGFSFYSNCEIARVDLWRQPMVKDYLQRIDEAGGIYKVRWSDASIHFLATSIFLAAQEMVQLVFLPYWHQNVVILPQPWSESDTSNPDGTPKTDSRAEL